jgi:hypothetical protein
VKKKKPHPKQAGEYGYLYSGIMEDPEEDQIVYDLPIDVIALLGGDPEEILTPLGFPEGVQFNCLKKKEVQEAGELMAKADQPDWCCLQIIQPGTKKNGDPSTAKPRRMFCISYVSTKYYLTTCIHECIYVCSLCSSYM